MGRQSSLRLHPKYGVNATIPLCFICEKPRNEVVLLGAAYKDEAPRHMKVDVGVCDACQEKYLKSGVLLIEAERDACGKYHPTGTLAVVSEAAYERVFGNKPHPSRRAFTEPGVLKKIGAL